MKAVSKAHRLCLIALFSFSSSSAALVSSSSAAPQLDDGDWSDAPRVIAVPMPEALKDSGPALAQGLRVVYVNFDGITLTGSNNVDDAVSDTSAIPTLGGVIGPGQTLTVPAFQPNQLGNSGGLSRAQIISRVINELYASHAPYNVEFVTTRPAGTYSMVVVGGSCQSVAGQSGCGGIALLDCGDNMPSNITFMFPPGLRVGDIASVTAQEAAHAFGLSHTDDRSDVMFPQIQQSIPTRFGAGQVPDTPNCGASFQDSNQLMLSTIGARGADTIPPAVMITSPADAAIVAPLSSVSATVTDNVLVANVEFLVAGAVVAEQAAGPFVFTLPSSATSGAIDVEVRATDGAGNVASAIVGLTISADGSEGNLGELCVSGDECDSGVCATRGDEQRCSRDCNAQTPCPSGFECVGEVACWPESSGGCQVASSNRGGPFALAFLALLAFARRRRRG